MNNGNSTLSDLLNSYRHRIAATYMQPYWGCELSGRKKQQHLDRSQQSNNQLVVLDRIKFNLFAKHANMHLCDDVVLHILDFLSFFALPRSVRQRFGRRRGSTMLWFRHILYTPRLLYDMGPATLTLDVACAHPLGTVIMLPANHADDCQCRSSSYRFAHLLHTE